MLLEARCIIEGVREMSSGLSLRDELTRLVRDAGARVQGRPPLKVLRELIDALPVAALVADDDGRFVAANAAAAALTGYKVAELCKLSVWQITPGADAHDAESLWRAFRTRREQSGTGYRVLCKDGRVRTAEYAAVMDVFPGFHVSLLRESHE